MAKRTAALTDTDDPAVTLAALMGKIRTIRERDQALVAQQIEFEQASVAPEPPRPETDVEALTRSIMSGFAPPKLSGSDRNRLHSILVERAAIRNALATLEERQATARLAAISQS